MSSSEKKVWFPAKRYGWGWTFPNCWQGWLVFAIWLGFLVGGSFLLKFQAHLISGYAVFMSIILTAICYLKGEKPRWRWGDDPEK